MYYELLLIKTMNDGLLLALGLFIGAVLLICLVFKLYKKYDTAKSLMLMYIMIVIADNAGTVHYQLLDNSQV